MQKHTEFRDLEGKGLQPAFERVLMDCAKQIRSFPWDNQEAYCMWLAQTYYMVHHTPRLLIHMAAKVPLEQEDAFKEVMHHLKEETNHDMAAVKDLKFFGKTPQDYPELPESRLIVSNNYARLHLGSAYALHGYSHFLEGLSVTYGPEATARVKAAGWGNATAFLRLHVEGDEDHFAEGKERLAMIPERFHKEILLNLEESSLLYCQILWKIQEWLKKGSAPVAA